MDLLTHKFNTVLFDSITMNSNQSSNTENLNGLSLYAIQSIWSGASGTISLIVEATNVVVNPVDTDYSQIDTYSISTASGNRMLNVEKAGYSLVRVRLTQSSGAGTLKVIINGKVI